MVQLWRQIKPFFTPQKTLVVFMIVLYDNVQKKEGRKKDLIRKFLLRIRKIIKLLPLFKGCNIEKFYS